MTQNTNEIMTVDEIAAYLRIPKASVYKLAQEGRMPCQKVGRHWRFRKVTIDRWLDENPLRTNPQENATKEDENA